MSGEITRRNMIIQTAAGVGAAAMAVGAAGSGDARAAEAVGDAKRGVKKGRIKQSVCQWCFKSWDKEEFCTNAQKLGLYGIDLVGPDTFETLKKHNLIGTMTPSHGISVGLNRKEHWDECLKKIRDSIDATAAAGFPNVICFSGDRVGPKDKPKISDEEGLKTCTEALKQVVGYAEEKKVTLCMELLNSKQHKNYMCDHTAWGVELCKAVGSERFKLLYDIYHMQMMEGDVIATIRANKDYIAHYHTAGVPGRHEIDGGQELNYPAIMRAIAETGFKGYVAQEFVPKRDPATSLAEAARICVV